MTWAVVIGAMFGAIIGLVISLFGARASGAMMQYGQFDQNFKFLNLEGVPVKFSDRDTVLATVWSSLVSNHWRASISLPFSRRAPKTWSSPITQKAKNPVTLPG